MMPRTGNRWPRSGACECGECRAIRAARSTLEAAEVMRRAHLGVHFEITTYTLPDGSTGYEAHELAADDNASGRGVMPGCACAVCHERREQWRRGLADLPTYSGDQAPSEGSTRATPEPTPDPLAQVTCEEPAEEEPATVACHYCGDDHPEDQTAYFGFRRTRACCPSCRFECDRCGDEALQEDGRSVAVPQGYSQDWCEDCWRDCSWYCTGCEAAFSDAVSPRYAEDDDDHDYPRCPGCHRREEARREPVVFGMGPYHDEARRQQTRLIDSPWTTAHGGRRFGVELEVERSSVATRSAVK